MHCGQRKSFEVHSNIRLERSHLTSDVVSKTLAGHVTHPAEVYNHIHENPMKWDSAVPT